jgi:hypothetical protein
MLQGLPRGSMPGPEAGAFFSRIVVIVGHEPGDMAEVLGPRLPRRNEVLLLSIGYPATAEQQEAFREALHLAAEAGAVFDSRLVLSARAAIAFIEPEDEVTIAAAGREGRRIEAVLRRRGPSSARAAR